MLLTYRNLRQMQAHPANMWWFFRVAPYVYDRGKLVEDQFAEWLYALRDARHVTPAPYTRVYAPAQTAEAAGVCAAGCRDLATARDWLNTRAASWGHPGCPYVTAGPCVEQWAAVNTQHDLPLEVRGKQRTRCRFQVSSPDGIREVIVHNADYGIVRRFLANGKTTFSQEFDLVHDRDHTLTLEVVDVNGRKAISDAIYLFCYKTSIFRCGDNLNFLCFVGLCWHPDRNEMMNVVQGWQGPPVESCRGYDTFAPLTSQAVLRPAAVELITTAELGQYPAWTGGNLRKILDIRLPGNDVKICEMTMGPLVEPFDSKTRDGPAMSGVPAVVAENKLFTRVHRCYYLQNRNNMFLSLDYRREREGAKDYRGGLVWHEGKITFKRDAVLTNPVPMMLFYFTPSGSCDGAANTLLVKDAGGGPTVFPIPKGMPFGKEGFVAPGGFVTASPCDIYGAFFAGAGTRFRYALGANRATGRVDQLQVGLGQPGQHVHAGEELTYRFALANLGGARQEPDRLAAQLEDISESFGIGGSGGVSSSFAAGSLLGREMFFTVKAAAGEASFKIEPRRTIVDLPIRLKGIEDNGCVAVYSTARPFFRFVGVSEGAAWFQENVDAGSTIWAGNVFLCDHKALKLTLVCDGLAPGRKPFLEVHNPTDELVHAVIVSPPHTPRFGGVKLTADVPAGSSARLPLPLDDGKARP
jgi:hypothetical protein